MSVTHYRLCFDAPKDMLFRDKEHFVSWLSEHMPDVDTFGIGYIIIPAHELVNQAGRPCWFAMIRGQSSYDGYHRDFMTQLSENGWIVDGVRALVYVKHDDQNEVLFPIRAAA